MHAVQAHYADPILDSMVSREILIDNRDNSNDHEDYQVELEIDKGHLFFAGQDSLRFVDENLKIIDIWDESFPDALWIEVPKICASAMCALRMVDSGPSASSASDGDATFELFDDFEAFDPYVIGSEHTPFANGGVGAWDEETHTFQPVHKDKIQVINQSFDGTQYKYWGYYCDVDGYAIGLVGSDDLETWTKYSNNPILQSASKIYRWPSVYYDGSKFQMILHDVAGGQIKRYDSTGGITFAFVQNITAGYNPFLYFNSSDSKFYLYYKVSPDIYCKSASTLAALPAAAAVKVLSKPSNLDTVASPSMIYADGLYWLATEARLTSDPTNWVTKVFKSSYPDGENSGSITEIAGSPVLINNDACAMHFWNDVATKKYLYYSHGETPDVCSSWVQRFREIEAITNCEWSGQSGSYGSSDDRAFDGSHSLKKTAGVGHDNSEIYQSVSTQNIEVSVRMWNSNSLDKRGGPWIGISAGNYLVVYIDPGNPLKILEFTFSGVYVAGRAEGALSAISSDQWCRLILRKLGNTYTAFAYNAAGTQIGTCTYDKTATTGTAGLHFYDVVTQSDQFLVRKYTSPEPTAEIGAMI